VPLRSATTNRDATCHRPGPLTLGKCAPSAAQSPRAVPPRHTSSPLPLAPTRLGLVTPNLPGPRIGVKTRRDSWAYTRVGGSPISLIDLVTIASGGCDTIPRTPGRGTRKDVDRTRENAMRSGAATPFADAPRDLKAARRLTYPELADKNAQARKQRDDGQRPITSPTWPPVALAHRSARWN